MDFWLGKSKNGLLLAKNGFLLGKNGFLLERSGFLYCCAGMDSLSRSRLLVRKN